MSMVGEQDFGGVGSGGPCVGGLRLDLESEERSLRSLGSEENLHFAHLCVRAQKSDIDLAMASDLDRKADLIGSEVRGVLELDDPAWLHSAVLPPPPEKRRPADRLEGLWMGELHVGLEVELDAVLEVHVRVEGRHLRTVHVL